MTSKVQNEWEKRQSKSTCKRCKGSGHDKGGLPLVKFQPVRQRDGTVKRQHHTIKQGSGCLACGGTGVIK